MPTSRKDEGVKRYCWTQGTIPSAGGLFVGAALLDSLADWFDTRRDQLDAADLVYAPTS